MKNDDRVVGVYGDEQSARRAAEAAERAGADVEVGADRDHVAAVQGEMREEMEHTFVGPGNVGPFTKEMAKGMAVWVPVGSLVGVALGVLAALFLDSDVGTATKLGVGAASGLAAGATVGFMIGMAVRKARGYRSDTLAAERGVVVGAESPAGSGDRVAEVMAKSDPIRVDKVGRADVPVGTVTTEEDQA